MRVILIGLLLLCLMFFVAFIFALMMVAGEYDDLEDARWEKYERDKQDND